MPANHLIPCRPLLLLPSIVPSIRVLPNESVLRVRWPKYCSFSFNISLSKEDSELICFRMDWLDLLAVQGTLKSLLQHHSSKASVLQHSAFFTVQVFIVQHIFYVYQLVIMLRPPNKVAWTTGCSLIFLMILWAGDLDCYPPSAEGGIGGFAHLGFILSCVGGFHQSYLSVFHVPLHPLAG